MLMDQLSARRSIILECYSLKMRYLCKQRIQRYGEWDLLAMSLLMLKLLNVLELLVMCAALLGLLRQVRGTMSFFLF